MSRGGHKKVTFSGQIIMLLVKEGGGGGGGVPFVRGVQTLSVEQTVLWYKMIFCVFFLFFFFLAFTAAKEFSSMVTNRTLLNVRLLTVYFYNRMLTFDHK